MKKSTKECRKDCDVYDKWQADGEVITDLQIELKKYRWIPVGEWQPKAVSPKGWTRRVECCYVKENGEEAWIGWYNVKKKKWLYKQPTHVREIILPEENKDA